MQSQCNICEGFDSKQFWSKCETRPVSECWPWLGYIGWGGYGIVQLPNGKSERAHRVSYMLSTQAKLQPRDCISHRCTRRDCINPHHLYLGKSCKRSPIGSQHGRAKLHEDEARMIRVLRSQGRTITSLASQYHVNISTISRLVLHQTWQHL